MIFKNKRMVRKVELCYISVDVFYDRPDGRAGFSSASAFNLQ